MDNKTDYRNNNSLKTDLRLLLECLKFQMKSPDLQKQSLLTIHSICEKREDTVDILRELGGVTFIQNLSKSSVVHEDVKEAALFTLGTVAEANVYCKNSLCRKETFVQLACLLMKEDTPLTQKRVSVYFLSVLIANNTCVQQSFFDSGALDTLALALIRQASAADQSVLSYQLSVTISKTLSACITDNRPLASGLVSYDLVPHLFSVLTSPHLESEDSLSVLLTLCHCTEASEENQFQLVECGGLPLIITLLTEDSNEEVRKAATFILQTCKQASKHQFFKPPLTTKQMSSSSPEQGLQGQADISVEERVLSPVRCVGKTTYFLPVCFLFLGCVLSFDEVTSRTFSSLQSACRHSCDMHKVLQEATERFRERNKRKSFSCEEVAYLLRGVETYGSSWNSILWSYPFKPGRSNVSLAKKYSLLRNRKVKDSVCE
ncbi:Telomere repeats-binding bouquet formation protein 1 [Takifugu flavidus]|uniref:Telomere repeats-binding bouquet formation protein 1 n=1 Tax=Takifugu flavidus TaxID=433684 RepID=A0A5C6P9F4_9TELE|nr:Telomere repeats-binding bouquet formation protein 1 [Takifugu flavidus]